MKAKRSARHYSKNIEPLGNGIICPHCEVEGENTVKETRRGVGTILRRRKCVKCGYIFKTVERTTGE